MPISDEFSLLFVHIPKNAGTSLEESLKARQTGHKTWVHYRDKHPLEWRTYTTFAVLRDPVERFVSCYNYARMEKSFWHSSIPGDSSKWGAHPDHEVCKSRTINEVVSIFADNRKALSHPGWAPQYFWINNNGKCAVDCLINFSRINDAISQLAPKASLKHINGSASACEEMLDSRSLSTLSELYKSDMSLFSLFHGCKNALLWSEASKSKRIGVISQAPSQQ